MKKNIFSIITYFALLFQLLFAYGCEEDVTPLDKMKSQIYGKWDWVITYRGHIWGTSTETPESTGKRASIEYIKDTLWRYYQNDTLISTGYFHISQEGNRFMYQEKQTIDSFQFISTSEISILKDTLKIDNYEWSDADWSSKYVKH